MPKIQPGIAALVPAVVLAVAAWGLALFSSPVTGPQPMAWHKADGSPPTAAADSPYGVRGCVLADINFDMALWNGGVIVPCRNEALGAGWAFLDPRKQEATLRWPLPDSGEVLYSVGLVPGSDKRFAIVFQLALPGDAFVGVAGPQGWERAPENLGRVRYLAGAWVGSRLELVVVPLTGADRFGFRSPVKVLAFEGTERRERVAVPACGNECQTPKIAYRAGGRWVFENAGGAIAEGGEPVAPAFPGRTLNDDDLDLVAQGRLRTPTTLSLGRPDTPGIGADGKPSNASPPPWSGMRVVRQNRFAIDDVLRRRPQWGNEALSAITEQVGDRTLTWHTDSDDHVRISGAPQPAAEAISALPAVAQWPQALASRVFVPDGTAGFWLVDSAGESIHLDSALRRTDPLSLRQHLLSSRGAVPLYALGWALFGLPILLAVCVGLSLCIGPRRPVVRERPVQLAAVLYLVSAGWALFQFVPLL